MSYIPMDESLLTHITSPSDLKKLSKEDLPKLASEIRSKLIESISQTGGHLASNLGSVELTIALHYVFCSPEDAFVWDVGHQCYTHKMLTGRKEQLRTLRQTNGLSGFIEPKESIHDIFQVGHAGTALSQALGLAKQRDILDEDHYIVSLIGDATLTCGLSLEALNNMSRDLKKFIVILNDNEMSISKNVGAISNLLSRMLNNPLANRFYQEVEGLVKRVPGYGNFLAETGHRFKEAAKHLFSPAVFFEHFGLSYIGPLDGHNVEHLVHTLQAVRNSEWPVIIHVLTEKGRGMQEAEKNPILWHGAKPFCPDTGKFHASLETRPTFPKLFGSYIAEMGRKDKNIAVVTPAMSAGSCLDTFAQEFPKRFFDVGIAEGHCVTFSGALAHKKKLRVFCSVYSTFLQRALDNVFHDVCLQEIPLVFAIDRAGIAGGDGATHNGIYDISFLSAMPNMVLCQPRNGNLLKDLMESAHEWNLPTAIRYPNLPTSITNRSPFKRPLGKAEILQEGEELLLLPLGHLADTALEVASLWERERGIRPTVVDPIFIKPLDEELFLELMQTHSLVVTIEEHSPDCGFGSLMGNFLLKNLLETRFLKIALPDNFIEQGKYKDLIEQNRLDSSSIFEEIKAFEQDCKVQTRGTCEKSLNIS
jgi:1-deoxy-D-xylulose-5-phosphate synthase